MSVIDTLIQRNQTFAASGAANGLNIIPSMRLLVVGCVDPRVDPVDVLGLEPGEAAIVRNVGGRITPDVFATMAMLRVVAKSGGGEIGAGWNFVVLHHTDCGINHLTRAPDMLAKYFGVTPDRLESLAITDPYASVTVDVAALKANPNLPGAFLVTGLVYDVATGRIDVVAPTSRLRPD